MPRNDNYLLDTHVWIWLLNGSLRLKESNTLGKIVNASKNSSINISAISIWEIAMLEAKGRIIFSTEINNWVDKALKAPGLNLIPLLPSISIDSTRLPGTFQGDPADRIIVATARYLQCPILTADKKILSYSSRGMIKAIKV
ncbi:MAG: type II toxin-antitoxin system VapC family toxin [Chitinispirillia bacterium]|jgi:PIN domain nuclease of toxin-antitoxin system